MVQSYDNSIISSGLNQVIVEEGRVINVNMLRWTADVRTDVNQSLFLDIQWGNPYLHFAQGEGIFAMPEVGAKCMVCRPSDSPPFIMCFTTAFERDQSGANSSQAERDLSEGQEQSNSNISFAAGRPQLQQGDLMLRCRDGNQIWLRRGGVVEVGSTAISKRLYIPLLNYIRDFCENYSMHTFGGDLSWTVKRVENDPDGEAKATLSILAKNAAQDEKASISLRVGNVSEDDRLSLIIAPNDINMETHEVGSALFELKIDKEGSVEITSGKDITSTVEGDLSTTVQGDASYTFQGGHTVDVTGTQDISVSGTHKLTASNSEEQISGGKVIQASSIELGGSGSQPICLFPALNAWLASHSHAPTGGPPLTPPPPFNTSITRAK